MKIRKYITIVFVIAVAVHSIDAFRSTRAAERILIKKIVRDLRDSSKVFTIENVKMSFVGGFYGEIIIVSFTADDKRDLLVDHIVSPDTADRIKTIVLVGLKEKRFLCPHMYGYIHIYYDGNENYVCHMIKLYREDVI